MEQLRRNQTPAVAKNDPNEQPGDTGQPKDKPGTPKPDAGTTKDGGGNPKDDKGQPKDAGKPAAADGMPPNPQGKPGEPGDIAKDIRPGQQGNAQASAPGTGGRKDELPPAGSEPTPGSPDPANQKRAGDLQLVRDVKKALDAMPEEERRKLLRQLNLSDDFYKDLTRVENDLARNERPEMLPDPKHAGALSNQGPRRAADGKAAPGDVKATGPAQPPAEFRDAYRDFTSKIGSGPPPQEKK
jgi:hypothetical protein